ncbi:MAG: RecQ family ATP-dependent DNA helicase [Clostridia bacterium]|nr:RecQ family ATP-dependent DNA helicase [Clostridia bacterium]
MDKKKKQLVELLKIHFNYGSFRPGQEKAIDAILAGKNVLAVLPTGGGKSMIFQLPALILEGISIVVSPLIALMKDQVDSLSSVGIPATFINSSISLSETNTRLKDVANGSYRLVYVAPERFYNKFFLEQLKAIKVSLFAIDEAHCISQWGHDFRPSYLRLKEVIKLCGSPIVVALTATATPEVREDIIRQLALNNYESVISGFERPNLHFAVVLTNNSKKLEYILSVAREQEDGFGIIYAGTRSKVDEIVEFLSDNGIPALAYHAGMDSNSREWVQERFMKGEVKIVVATNAFGLGINKKDIRFVIHNDLPGTVEAYYQEAGRAGRDAKDSYCILFYSPSDRYLQEFFIAGDNPSPELIKDVYRFLIDEYEYNQEADSSILITYSELSKRLAESAPEMAIGTAIKILEKGAYVSRPNERTTNSFIKLSSDWDDLFAGISKRAKSQREMAEKLKIKFGSEIERGWQFIADDLAIILHVKKEALVRVVKKLAEQDLIKYRPPFKGTEIKILKFVNPDKLSLDFSVLEEKSERAYNKLNEMENYAHSSDCRQKHILEYFGEKNVKRCGHCDNCLNPKRKVKHEYLGTY